MNTLYIYTSPSNKVYVGVTSVTIRKRIKGHLRSNSVFGAALRKYGVDNFKLRMFQFDTIEEAYETEAYLVTKREVQSTWYYNQCIGGYGAGQGMSDVTKESKCSTHSKLMSEWHKDGTGPLQLKESRIANVIALQSEEHRNLQSVNMKRKWEDPVYSKVAKERSKLNSGFGKSICIDDIMYISISEAGRSLGLDRKAVRNRLKASNYTTWIYI